MPNIHITKKNNPCKGDSKPCKGDDLCLQASRLQGRRSMQGRRSVSPVSTFVREAIHAGKAIYVPNLHVYKGGDPCRGGDICPQSPHLQGKATHLRETIYVPNLHIREGGDPCRGGYLCAQSPPQMAPHAWLTVSDRSSVLRRLPPGDSHSASSLVFPRSIHTYPPPPVLPAFFQFWFPGSIILLTTTEICLSLFVGLCVLAENLELSNASV